MEQNNIDIYEILKSMPKGTKLYSPMCGEVDFSYLSDNKEQAEAIWTEQKGADYTFNKFGQYTEGGECLLFPSKSMRDWTKFTWKKGDVLISNDGTEQVVFEEFVNEKYLYFNGKYLFESNVEGLIENVALFTSNFHKTDSKEHIEFIENKLGGKLNLETLEIEKTQPGFKDGDVLMFSFNFNGKQVHCPLIFKGFTSSSDFTSYVMQDAIGGLVFDKVHSTTGRVELRLATDEEKGKFFNLISSKGYRWDDDKKNIVKSLVPGKLYYFEMENELAYIAKLEKAEGGKFTFSANVSWCPRNNTNGYDYEESSFSVSNEVCFGFREADADQCKIFDKAKNEHKKQPLKFKPLDYVLAKYESGDEWVLCQYSHTDKDGYIVFVGGNMTSNEVIPYAGNEELLGVSISVGDGE